MSTTTNPDGTTTARTGATAATVGGAMWALLPVAFALAPIQSVERGTMSFVAVAAAGWLFAVAPLALLLLAVRHLHARLAAGPLRTPAGIGYAIGLALMLVGNGVEMATLTATGEESAVGHAAFLIGFLVLLVCSVLLGVALLRRHGDALTKTAAFVLVLALPLGVGLGALGMVLAPAGDLGFWAAIAVPTGVAWVLLGRRPAGRRATDRAPVTA